MVSYFFQQKIMTEMVTFKTNPVGIHIQENMSKVYVGSWDIN